MSTNPPRNRGGRWLDEVQPGTGRARSQCPLPRPSTRCQRTRTWRSRSGQEWSGLARMPQLLEKTRLKMGGAGRTEHQDLGGV